MSKHKAFRASFTLDGRRYEVEADTEIDLQVALKLRKDEIEKGTKRISRNMTVKAWSNEYLEVYRRDNISDIYYQGLCGLAKIINKSIGNMKLKDVKKIHCQKVLADMAGRSREYVGKVRGLMNDMFEEAVDQDPPLMLSNPARRLKIPATAKKKEKRRPATETEKRLLLKAGRALGDPYEAYIILMLYFGLRPSEACRVMPCHFDLKKMKLRVQGTKSENATRDVPIAQHLRPWIEKYAADPFAFIIKNRDGRAVDKSGRFRIWRAIRREVNISLGCEVYRNEVRPPYGLAEDLTAYCLRHTYASDMIAKEVPKEIVSLIMGHADVDMTDTYIGMTEEMFDVALARTNGVPRGERGASVEI
jgi:integrase